MQKPEICEAILVEGRYDKNTLSQVVEALILQTDGFQIYRDENKRKALRKLAEERGLIILTDSDAAGFQIRKCIRSFIPAEYLKHAYIPDIYGKEKRKQTPGKEGKLGVEGMQPEVLLAALKEAGATFRSGSEPHYEKLTIADLYAAGFTGTSGSRERKAQLYRDFCLPEHLSTKDLPDALSSKISRRDFLNRYVNKEKEKE